MVSNVENNTKESDHDVMMVLYQHLPVGTDENTKKP
jgi:hypothetical protein